MLPVLDPLRPSSVAPFPILSFSVDRSPYPEFAALNPFLAASLLR
jgi:hypothetical protein